jgi:hypothetical protein
MIDTIRALLTRRPPWERRGHFRTGDQVLTHPCEPIAETVAWIKNGQVGLTHNAQTTALTVWTEASQVRHVHGCPPCQDDLAAQRIAWDKEQTAYWNQWPKGARDVYDQAMDEMIHHQDHTLSFGLDTPVAAWMRAEFDGRMHPSESPSLALGRIWATLDWPRICREHPDFVLEPVWLDNRDTAALLTAYQLLRSRGFDPYLDVDLEMELQPTPGEPTTITASGSVTRLAVEQPLDNDTYEEITCLLGEDASTHPYSSLNYPLLTDGPGEDHSQPYTPSTNDETVWGW